MANLRVNINARVLFIHSVRESSQIMKCKFFVTHVVLSYDIPTPCEPCCAPAVWAKRRRFCFWRWLQNQTRTTFLRNSRRSAICAMRSEVGRAWTTKYASRLRFSASVIDVRLRFRSFAAPVTPIPTLPPIPSSDPPMPFGPANRNGKNFRILNVESRKCSYDSIVSYMKNMHG